MFDFFFFASFWTCGSDWKNYAVADLKNYMVADLRLQIKKIETRLRSSELRAKKIAVPSTASFGNHLRSLSWWVEGSKQA